MQGLKRVDIASLLATTWHEEGIHFGFNFRKYLVELPYLTNVLQIYASNDDQLFYSIAQGWVSSFEREKQPVQVLSCGLGKDDHGLERVVLGEEPGLLALKPRRLDVDDHESISIGVVLASALDDNSIGDFNGGEYFALLIIKQARFFELELDPARLILQLVSVILVEKGIVVLVFLLIPSLESSYPFNLDPFEQSH